MAQLERLSLFLAYSLCAFSKLPSFSANCAARCGSVDVTASEIKKKLPASCLAPPPTAIQHQQGLLRSGPNIARVSFSTFCTQKAPQVGYRCRTRPAQQESTASHLLGGIFHAFQVYLHLGKSSVSCCLGDKGSFAPQFISENLGAAADSIAVEASAEFASAAERAGTPEVVQPRARKIQKLIWDFQKLFTSYGTSACVSR